MLLQPPGAGSPHQEQSVSGLRPIFILGTFHSATTILYRLLAMHPDTTWFSQFSLRDGSIPGRRRLPFYRQIDRVSRRIFEHDWEKRGDNRRDLIAARPTEGQLIWEYIIPRSGSDDPTASVNRIRHILETHGRHYKKRYFLAKYPYITRHVPILATAYPRAKFVHIVRDGRAVALSLKSTLHDAATRDHVFLDGRQIAKSDLSSIEVRGRVPTGFEPQTSARLGEYWLECVNMIQAERERIDLTEIRYEDFCGDVHGHLTALLRNIGLSLDRFPLTRCPVTLASTNERRFQAASPGELEALEDLMSDELRLYSYL